MRPNKVRVTVKQNERLVVISRRVGEGININGDSKIVVSKITPDEVTLFITAPKSIDVSRFTHKPETEKKCSATN